MRILVLFLLALPVSAMDFTSWTDEYGRTHYSNISKECIDSGRYRYGSCDEPQYKEVEKPAKADLSAARGSCYMAIKNQLHDPFTAKPGEISQWPAKDNGDGLVAVRPTIRAKNGYGAYQKSEWVCATLETENYIQVISLERLGD